MRIVYVEDNQMNLALVERIARVGGHEVISYSNGEVALEALRNIVCDIILMDIELEGKLDGTQVVRALRERGDKRPIVAVTAYAMMGDRERIMQSGCDDYLPKPVPIAQLLALLAKYDPNNSSPISPITPEATTPSTTSPSPAKTGPLNSGFPAPFSRPSTGPLLAKVPASSAPTIETAKVEVPAANPSPAAASIETPAITPTAPTIETAKVEVPAANPSPVAASIETVATTPTAPTIETAKVEVPAASETINNSVSETSATHPSPESTTPSVASLAASSSDLSPNSPIDTNKKEENTENLPM